jgi:surface-anchored protein
MTMNGGAVRQRLAVLGLTAAGVLGATPSQASAQSFEHPAVLSDTTAQIAPRLQDGELQLGILDRAGDGTWHEPSRAVLFVDDAAKGEVPDDPAFAFIGVPGELIWRTTGTPEPRPAGILRTGVNTTGVPASALQPGSDVTLTLSTNDSDASLFFYEDDAEGRPVAGGQWFNSADGLPDAKAVALGVDINLGAAFQGGYHCLEVTASATLASGETVRDREWLTIDVGGDPSTVRPCGGPNGVHVFDLKHLDLAPQLRDGELELKVDAYGLTNFDDAVFHARSEHTRLTLPDPVENGLPEGSFRFLGDVGQTVWNLPESQEGDQLWPGFNLYGAPNAEYQGELSWRLLGVSSADGSPPPGEAILWFGDAMEGAPPLFSTRTGLPATYGLHRSGSHFHYNWTFTSEGVYCLNFAIDGRSASGAPIATSEVLTVVVGDLDPSAVTPCGRLGTRPVAGPATVPDAPSGGTPIVAAGSSHYELAPELRDGELRVPVHETDRWGEGPGVDRDLDDVVFYTRRVFDGGLGERPWLGSPGESLYVIWPVAERNHPMLGWDQTRIASDRLRGDLRWRLVGVDGPGTVAVEGGSEQPPLLGTVPGYERSTFEAWPGTRERALLWAFSQPGVHCVELEWSGTLASGEPVSTRETVTFVTDVAEYRQDPVTGPVEVPPTIDPATVTPCGRSAEEPVPDPPSTPPADGGPPATPAPPAARAKVRVALRRPAVRRGALRVPCGLDAPGRCAVRAWVTAREARRLRLPRPRGATTVTIGRGAATLARPGRRAVTVKLHRRAWRALKRSARGVRVRLTATATAPGRTSATATIVAVVRIR